MASPDETLVSDLATGTISLALLSVSVVLHDSVEYLCCCCGVISARDVIKDVLVGDRGFNFPFLFDNLNHLFQSERRDMFSLFLYSNSVR